MSPYRDEKRATTTRSKSGGDASWVLVLAALPIVIKTVSFPEHTWNAIAFVLAAIASAGMALYTFALFALTMTHMLPSARRDLQHRGAGIFEPRNFDDAGQELHRRFRHACMLLALVAMLSGVVVIVFPL